MASGAKHTPGPWSVPHFAIDNVNCNCGYVLVENALGAVAKVYWSDPKADWRESGDNPSPEECVANARLIAAAPELLAGLKDQLDGHWATWMAAHASLSRADTAAQLFEREPDVIRARALIAKFEG